MTIAAAFPCSGKTQAEGGGFTYTGRGKASVPLTAASLYCLHQAGRGEEESARKALKDLTVQVRGEGNRSYPFYSLMWSAAAMAKVGDQPAENFAEWMVQSCAERQKKNGSWDGRMGDVFTTICIVIAHGSQR